MAAEIIDVLVAVRIPFVGTRGAGHVDRIGLEIARHVRDAVRKQGSGAGMQRPRPWSLFAVGVEDLGVCERNGLSSHASILAILEDGRIAVAAESKPNPLPFGSEDLRLPDELRTALRAHLAALRNRYVERGWAGRVGFGRHPALIVIDLALWWTDRQNLRQGSDVDSVVDAACRLLQATGSVNDRIDIA